MLVYLLTCCPDIVDSLRDVTPNDRKRGGRGGEGGEAGGHWCLGVGRLTRLTHVFWTTVLTTFYYECW